MRGHAASTELDQGRHMFHNSDVVSVAAIVGVADVSGAPRTRRSRRGDKVPPLRERSWRECVWRSWPNMPSWHESFWQVHADPSNRKLLTRYRRLLDEHAVALHSLSGPAILSAPIAEIPPVGDPSLDLCWETDPAQCLFSPPLRLLAALSTGSRKAVVPLLRFALAGEPGQGRRTSIPVVFPNES
jgi:hypothetical protein